ncbi:uncharacterized protein [Amphiura filiformis]|uniref:uncharacterized protein n=1 Tax=Amphiura filiformis TaxID=82378 RepID=UPI003B2253DF
MIIPYVEGLSEKTAVTISVVESWQTGDNRDNHSIADFKATLPGYDIFSAPRIGRKGGGICVIYRREFDIKANDVPAFKSFECVDLLITSTDRSQFRLISIYRPPPSKENHLTTNQFLDEFSSLLETIAVYPGRLVIAGDINFHVDDYNDRDASRFLNILTTAGLKQHISGSTHKKGHTLDLIISHDAEALVVNPYVNHGTKSDHSAINNIRQKLDDAEPPPMSIDLQDSCTASFQEFEPISNETVRKIIMDSSKSSCALDPMPTRVLASPELLDVIVPIITKIINASLCNGDIPSVLKEALVRPLLKKPNLDRDKLNNYRPISNLPFLFKTRVAVQQLQHYVAENGLHAKHQSAYRKHHSVETALVRVTNDILRAVDSHKHVVVALLDLSAAFDTLDHAVLLSRFKERFGINGTAFRWLTSYFTGRKLTGMQIRHSVWGDANVPASSTARNLGVIIDDHMTLSQHVSSICRSASFALYNIGKLRKYLDQASVETLVHSFVTSR